MHLDHMLRQVNTYLRDQRRCNLRLRTSTFQFQIDSQQIVNVGASTPSSDWGVPSYSLNRTDCGRRPKPLHSILWLCPPAATVRLVKTLDIRINMRRSLSLSAPTALMLLVLAAEAVEDSVRPDGVGALQVGMTIHQMEQLLRERIEMPSDTEDGTCFYVEPKRYPKLSFMIEGRRLQRIDIRESGVTTDDGIQIGDSAENVKSKYGDHLKITPHFYNNQDGRYLTLIFGSGKFATRFETQKDVITSVYSGSYRQVHYVEGCL